LLKQLDGESPLRRWIIYWIKICLRHRIISEAKQDLEKAIELSGGKGKSAQQAFAQCGLIHRLGGNMELARVF
jgi:hypothetical protein